MWGKPIILTILCIFLSDHVHAQEQPFSLSFFYNPNISWVSGKIDNEAVKVSHWVESRLNYELNHFSKAFVGIGYLNTGQARYLDQQRSLKVLHHNNYLSFTLGAGLNHKQCFINMSLSAAYNVSNKDVILDNTKPNDEVRYDSIISNGEFSSFTFPIGIGVGYSFDTGRYQLGLGLQYYQSIDDVIDGLSIRNAYQGLGALMILEF